MAIKGGNRVRANMSRTLRNIAGPKTNKVVTEILIIGEGYAVNLTPVDTSNLINSRYRRVQNSATGTIGLVGYTANYAAYVHDGGPKNWQKSGAEDLYLKKAFERDGLPDIQAHLRRSYKQ